MNIDQAWEFYENCPGAQEFLYRRLAENGQLGHREGDVARVYFQTKMEKRDSTALNWLYAHGSEARKNYEESLAQNRPARKRSSRESPRASSGCLGVLVLALAGAGTLAHYAAETAKAYLQK